MKDNMRIPISSKGKDYLRRGGLWIFANEFQVKMNTLKKGEWVDFYFKDEFLGYGYVNPHSLIAGRICSRDKIQNRKLLLEQKISKCLELRESNLQSFRAVFAESDHLPGLIVDVYKHLKTTVVIQSSTDGMDEAQEDILAAVSEIFKPDELVWRADGSIRNLEGVEMYVKIIKGEEDAVRNGIVAEGDLLIAADFYKGQKTGFFIDQRENRLFLKSQSENKSVLDLCSYSGGWGLSALKGGASHVTFVDQSADALKLVQKGIELNKFKNPTKLVVKDVFEFFNNDPQTYDIVICDPPAFVKSKKNIAQAEQAYFKLNQQALKKVKPGGILFTCSCSYHLSEEKFTEILTQCFQSYGIEGSVVYKGSQSADHPWIINRPESHYLKCLGIKRHPN